MQQTVTKVDLGPDYRGFVADDGFASADRHIRQMTEDGWLLVSTSLDTDSTSKPLLMFWRKGD